MIAALLSVLGLLFGAPHDRLILVRVEPPATVATAPLDNTKHPQPEAGPTAPGAALCVPYTGSDEPTTALAPF